MITVTVTSDSGLHELKAVNKLISELITLRVGKDIADLAIEISNTVGTFTEPSIDKIQGHNPTQVVVDEVFNVTELAEAETMGKPVCSTVDASQSTIAPVDTQVNTSLPEPTSVFGQAAQTTANEVNRAVPLSELHAHDADGIKWDKRIHSSSKELNKDGTWRKRRGVDDALVKQVEAELRGHTSVVAEAYANVTGKTIEQAKHELNNGASVHSYNGGELVAIDANGVEHDTKPSLQPLTFTELLDGVTKAMVAGQLSQQRINEALQSIGLTALPHLLGNPQLIPSLRTALGGVV